MKRRIVRSIFGLLLFATSVPAADFNGIWVGQQAGRRGEPEDLAFRFKLDGQSVTGKMYGDEFDLPISEGSVSGDQIHFVVITTNYYNGTKTRFLYTGTIKDNEMELVRERVVAADDKVATQAAAKQGPTKQTLKLKRIK